MNKTYIELSAIAKEFLVYCGYFNVDEHERFEESSNTSANESLGLAVRILAEQAKELQNLADREEVKK